MTAARSLTWPDPTDPRVVERRAPALRQWRTMTARGLASARSQGEFTIAIAMPVVFALGLYLPLRLIMSSRGVDYAQYLMPIIVLQAAAFTAGAAAQRSALEKLRGMNRRLASMPVHPLVPFFSRMSVSTVRLLVSIAVSLVFGTILGFSFHGTVWTGTAFVLVGLTVGVVMAMAADSLGVLTRSPEATSQLMVLPQLVLGLLSTGFAPESGFPEWARPFARNQPVSHFSALMRELADGALTWHTAMPPLIWLSGLTVVFVALAAWTHRQRILWPR